MRVLQGRERRSRPTGCGGVVCPLGSVVGGGLVGSVVVSVVVVVARHDPSALTALYAVALVQRLAGHGHAPAPGPVLGSSVQSE